MKTFLVIACTVLLSLSSIGQSTWYEIPTGTTKKLNSISFPSNNVGYIVGMDSTILKTVNGGQTWELLGMNGILVLNSNDDFTDVHFVDENTGFLAGYSGVYKTTDGGQTWVFATGQMSNMCSPHTVYPFTGTDYLVGGGGCFEGAIIDHFTNSMWINANLSLNFWSINEMVVEMSFTNTNIGLAATRSKYILRTLDAGLNWDTISTGITGDLTSVLMVDDMLCYAGYDEMGSGFGILKSIDGGLSWDFDPNLGTAAMFINPNYLSVCSAQNGDVYSGANSMNTSEGVIFETPDGIVWSNTYVDQPINDMTSLGSDITFGVGDSGYVVVNTPIGDLGTVESDFVDFNAYPNPVSNELTIQNPNAETIEVIILDASGRVLKTKLVQPGSSTIDCSSLTDGMYFLNVKIGDKFGLQRIVKQE